jgi:tRNA A37 threonylcarbamoyladenosine dehydratase
VEACVSLFTAAVAARLLGDSPALVLDCIDDLPTKAELLGYCHEHGLRVL